MEGESLDDETDVFTTGKLSADVATAVPIAAPRSAESGACMTEGIR
jgi:hypothetical protein